MNNKSWKEIDLLEDIVQRMPDQRSTTDQLRDLLKIANKRGLYDAADVIAKLIEKTP